MNLRQIWAGAMVALLALSGAGFAEVTVSQSNDPTANLAGAISAMLGAEHSTVAALPDKQLASLAAGPDAKARKGKTADLSLLIAKISATRPRMRGCAVARVCANTGVAEDIRARIC